MEIWAPAHHPRNARLRGSWRSPCPARRPPCQGHSDLNNHTRRDDPRNSLYLRAIRAVELIKPAAVMIENVPAVRQDSTDVVDRAVTFLRKLGYAVDHTVVNLAEVGVPQLRRRHLLLAVRRRLFDPGSLLQSLSDSPCSDHLPRSVRWAIEERPVMAGTDVLALIEGRQ
jgi:DNA (cytosine-5)-methyltransferase 1